MKRSYFFVLVVLLFFSASPSLAQCSPATVPYFENFQSVTVNNQLPACWAASNMSVTCLTFSSTGGYAAFNYSPAATSHFFSRAIQLYAGVNYSVTLWFRVSAAASNWTNLSVLIGTAQVSAGMSTLMTTNLPGNTAFTALSNTFMVTSNGVYYLGVEGIGSPTGAAQYLIWDDLELTAQCSINPVQVTVSASHNTICAGSCATLSATGADNYLWSTGATSSLITVCASSISNYSVLGTNSVTGCTVSVNAPFIALHPTPAVSASANRTLVCKGEATELFAFGAATYSWSLIGSGSSVTVYPVLTNNFYTVTGTNNFGCQSTATILIRAATCTLSVKEFADADNNSVLFPNPFVDRLFLEFEKETEFELWMMDAQGRRVLEFRGTATKTDVDVGHLKSGVYILGIRTGQRNRYQKIVKY